MGFDASRRKNATRETTATLKAWLNEHKKNPYPTKGEKIMLAIITKMTLTQVRRHLGISFGTRLSERSYCPGVDVVRQRQASPQEGKQDDLGTSK